VSWNEVVVSKIFIKRLSDKGQGEMKEQGQKEHFLFQKPFMK
jgi:hypothetical protein